MSKRSVNPSKGLGRTQVLCLHLLANDEKSVRAIAMDGFGISESSAYSALQSLALRGLVDRHYLSSKRATVYFLTREGGAVERSLLDPNEAEERG